MATRKKSGKSGKDESQKNELLEAIILLEKEKSISRDSLFDAIENSLLTACKNNFGRAENIHCEMDRETCEYFLYAEKTVVENVEDDLTEITLEDAAKYDAAADYGSVVKVGLESKEFGRIATQNAKNVILQKIREEEKNAIFNEFATKEHNIVTGTVQRFVGRNISINLGSADAMLTENEQVKGEVLKANDRVKVYVLEVRNMTR